MITLACGRQNSDRTAGPLTRLPSIRWATVVTSSAKQYRELARECYFMARSLPPGEDRSALLKMAEEWDRLADEQEHDTDPAHEEE